MTQQEFEAAQKAAADFRVANKTKLNEYVSKSSLKKKCVIKIIDVTLGVNAKQNPYAKCGDKGVVYGAGCNYIAEAIETASFGAEWMAVDVDDKGFFQSATCCNTELEALNLIEPQTTTQVSTQPSMLDKVKAALQAANVVIPPTTTTLEQLQTLATVYNVVV